MEENVRKVRKTTICGGSRRSVKRGKVHRFAKWIGEQYGIPWRSIYDKIRQGKIKAWERFGIIRCMDEFGFHGNPGDLWSRCVRNKFSDFMKEKQMSRMTTWKRFSANDFSELEMKGISATYRYWRENIDSIKE